MSNVRELNNTVYWRIQRGISESLSIRLEDLEWSSYDEIKMDIKADKKLTSPVIMSLTVGNGLTIEDDVLVVELPYERSGLLKAFNYSADLKVKKDDKILFAVPFVIEVLETVTNMP